MPLRFTHDAAHTLRRAIEEAGGVEVFAIGDVEEGVVTEVVVTCRGRRHEVTALVDRPRAGQVVIHNHPSGDLEPSDADMALASRYGEDGVGVVIVDSAVGHSHWVVEPHVHREVAVDPARLERFFDEALRGVVPDWEHREGQLDMALEVAAALSEDRPLVCEAGTGTGKSLAYLVPAAMWATANEAKVVVSTYTRSLQAQLVHSDLPMITRAGLEFRAAALQGRNNYLCKRRLALVDDEEAGEPVEARVGVDALLQWEQTTVDGSRSDLPIHIEADLWERVWSDADLSLRVRCPHYATCHYYRARRQAAAAHLVVVNHALLLSDLHLRDLAGGGILPRYRRVIVDEGHHLEDAATGVVSRQLTARAIRRAASPLLPRRRRRGALDRLSGLPGPGEAAATRIEQVREVVEPLGAAGDAMLADLGAVCLDEARSPRRVVDEWERSRHWADEVRPRVQALATELEQATGALQSLISLWDGVQLDERQAQPLLDTRRAMRRLAAHALVARDFLERDAATCRWMEPARGRGESGRTALALAPIDLAPTLRRILWDPLPGAAVTSATMTVSGSFWYWQQRAGLEHATTALFPSPFDHRTQALLGLPRDLPPPDDPRYLSATAEALVQAVRISEGGAFVLCTSYQAVRHYARALREALPATWPVLAQRDAGRSVLLERFRDNRRAVLVGTDSFWEGVSVKGEALRLVVIPRLPFRVPTDPLRVARRERISQRGGDPFKAYSLPMAVIQLKQGYGRLIRTRTDRGAVLFLDRRLHDRAYGTVMLRSLPPARRITGPWRRVREELERFFPG